MHALAWIVGGLLFAGLATVLAMRRGHRSSDLGSVSGTWVAEHRASTEPNE
jgi:hypothetical protein